MSRQRSGVMRPYRKVRNRLYSLARLMGDVQPWLEGDPEAILRRYVNKWVGRKWSRFAYGGGLLARTIRRLV